LSFKVVPSNVIEKLNPRFKPKRQAEVLSLQKAEALASQFNNALIIGADTLVAFGDEVIGKPKNEKDAKQILKKLSGTMHVAITGFTIIDTQTKKKVTKSIETKVWFRKLQDQEIKEFIAKEKPYDKAGAYAAHELAAIFVEKIEGDFFGIIGLPLFALAKELKKFGVTLL
jgi:septum formation protein